jgi:hypothetical protein
MQIVESKNAFICFYLLFGIGSFQWVTTDSSKKIRTPLSRLFDSLLTPSLDRSD